MFGGLFSFVRVYLSVCFVISLVYFYGLLLMNTVSLDNSIMLLILICVCDSY